MAKPKKPIFIVVYEDEYNNKFTKTTKTIGTAVKEILEENEVISEHPIDFEKLNSDNPYSVGAFSLGFYDMYVYYRDVDKAYGDDYELTDEDYENPAGRFMIFEVEL